MANLVYNMYMHMIQTSQKHRQVLKMFHVHTLRINIKYKAVIKERAHNEITNLSHINQQKQSLAPPPHQAKSDASAETTPAGSEKPQEETPMEQEPSEEEPKSESSSEVKGKEEDIAESTKMPEHPGKDSDSEGSGAEQEQ